MKDRKEKSGVPILAAGGIVLRHDRDRMPQFAVVQSRKLTTWGLPKGKLVPGEDAMTAARREVFEETGHHVTVHEFVGTLVYETASRTKVVQFWRMETAGAPAGDLMRDIMAVDWLPLADAIHRLSHMRERVFLEQVGPIALELAERPAGAAPFCGHDNDGILVPGVPLAPAENVSLFNETTACTMANDAGLDVQERTMTAIGTAAIRAIGPLAQKSLFDWSGGGKTLMKKTWGWLRHAALYREPVE